jgi:hypothetical protein
MKCPFRGEGGKFKLMLIQEEKMKRFWLVLMSLGLMVAFSASAMAVDVKFSGEYYAAGMYLDRTTVKKGTATDGPSTAFYYQRLRVRTDFVVSPGLTLVTRADIMERAWGATRSGVATAAIDSAGTRAENENIAFDWAYIDYKSPIGAFAVGIMNDGSTGTLFGNSYGPKGRIKYSNSFGPVTLNLAYTKEKEQSTRNAVAGVADADNDKYGIEGVYSWKGGKAGLNVNYYNQRANRPQSPVWPAAPTAAGSYKVDYFLITPYAIAKIGPVALQFEVNYATGKRKYEDNVLATGTTGDKIDLQGLSGWIDATADFGKFYMGGTIAYVSGDDQATRDKNEGFAVHGGRDWNPCLILFNNDVDYWAGTPAGWDGTATSNAGTMINAYFGQLRAGVRPIDKLDIMLSGSYARADKTLNALPANTGEWVGRDYGYEVDLTGTYTITNNLSYMLGGGYFVAGDWYKGKTAVNQDTENNFLVINKLTLTF